jgi:gamma-glutamylcyclotransferase (GGCT)/AIG2-like uncharacterized protein YtfP
VKGVGRVPFRLFVYGTLRRGGVFHDRYCRGVLAIEEATVRGRLSAPRLGGYPVLEVPAADILAVGSTDPLADAHLLESLASRLPPSGRAAGTDEIPGELLLFDDPQSRLARLDELEGFDPSGRSLYRRVALPVTRWDGQRFVAWAYVRGDPEPATG